MDNLLEMVNYYGLAIIILNSVNKVVRPALMVTKVDTEGSREIIN